MGAGGGVALSDQVSLPGPPPGGPREHRKPNVAQVLKINEFLRENIGFSGPAGSPSVPETRPESTNPAPGTSLGCSEGPAGFPGRLRGAPGGTFERFFEPAGSFRITFGEYSWTKK